MTKIEWTNATWNPVIGCRKVSPGCRNCYAVNMAHRLASMPATRENYSGLTVKHLNGQLDWTGQVKCLPGRLEDPLRWEKSRLIFVNSMSDLFHEDVPFEFIDRVFAVMRVANQHTFQILTKRPQRMVGYFNHRRAWTRCLTLPNVWLGVSVENQKAADERTPLLLQCPAAIRWISAEPLLGPVDLTSVILQDGDALGTSLTSMGTGIGLDWVVCGGESGPNARPMALKWARALRDQCKQANVPFFFKQWGEWLPAELNGENAKGVPRFKPQDGHGLSEGDLVLTKNIYEWSPEERAYRVGKAKAGRTLDGQTHDEYPA